MTVLLRDLPLALDRDQAMLRDAAAEALGLPVASVTLHAIVRRSLDARSLKNEIANTQRLVRQSAQTINGFAHECGLHHES